MIKKEWVDAIKEIKYKDWEYQILGAPDYEYLQIRFFADGEDQYCRRWVLDNHMSVSDLIRTAWMATLAAEEHEARESFRYKGRKIFGPHFDVDRLVEIARTKENLDIKELVS